MTSHCETIKSSLNTGSNDKPLETPKISKTSHFNQNTAKYTPKQGHILTKTFIFSEILEKNEDSTKNDENTQKALKYVKMGLKSLKMRQSGPIVGQNTAKINKIHQIQGFITKMKELPKTSKSC